MDIAVPRTLYAKAGEVNIAYQVVGNGARDLIFVPGWVSHVEHYWANPACARFLRRLASFSRLMLFDKRGTGLSDRVERVPHLEERMDDIAAVLAAAGSDRAALFGFSEGGAIASLFAATYPERAHALVLYAANAKCTHTDDYPCGYTTEQAASLFTDYIEEHWGSGDALPVVNPSVGGDARVKEWLGQLERLGASPGAALALWRTDAEMDVRVVLPAIQAPTLILHRAGDQLVDVAHGRYLAERIAHARYLELPGSDHMPWFGDAERILDEVEEFLTGTRAVVIDRILATVMFTDIVGSTDLAARLGDRRWRERLESHHALVRDHLARHDGREIDTAGDGFFAAFDGPARAIACARAITSDVHSLGLEVRIGLHTGECEKMGAGLAGLAVHLGARIAALAGPGEIVVSRTVKDLVVGSGTAFVDRGEHRLKGVAEPWHVFEVASHDQVIADRPPDKIEPGPEQRERDRTVLAHVDPGPLVPGFEATDHRVPAARLPAPPTPTIGREADLAGLRDVLGEPASRLVTLVGPGGVGKTRLALELARSIGDQFRDGAYFVTLAPVTGDEHVAATIARQLDVVLMPSESPKDGLARQLGVREVLLVLDNFEHVLGAAPLVADLLAATTRLRVLVTSREPLRVRAERLFRLDPLALPPVEANGDAAGVEQAPAVALFLAVARARDADFALSEEDASAVARVCRRLDGLPLAIELAAARIGLLTVPELAARLREDLQALGSGTRDAPARQRTLTATLEWSYGLLTADERAALAGLAVFAGGCTLDAAQAVTAASLDVLEALVEKNLVVRSPALDGRTRLVLLETVADFARARLDERRDGDGVRQRHCDFYLALAERAAPELERSDRPALMAELDRELHNLRAALTWALDRNAARSALRLATALEEYWDLRSRREGARWLHAALALRDDNVPASVRAAALGAYAWCLSESGRFDDAEAAALESLELARSIGDVAQCANSTTALASALIVVGRPEDGYRCATEAERLAREADDESKHAWALHMRALSAPTLSEALVLGEQALAAHRRLGRDRGIAWLQCGLARNALVQGEHAAALRLAPEALRSAETLGDPFVLCFVHGIQGLVALLTGDIGRASEAFARQLSYASRYTYDEMLYHAINGLAGVAAARGEDELAARLFGAAEATGPYRHSPAISHQLDGRYFAAARARIGERAWQLAHTAGAALTPRQAVDTALRAQQVASSVSG